MGRGAAIGPVYGDLRDGLRDEDDTRRLGEVARTLINLGGAAIPGDACASRERISRFALQAKLPVLLGGWDFVGEGEEFSVVHGDDVGGPSINLLSGLAVKLLGFQEFTADQVIVVPTADPESSLRVPGLGVSMSASVSVIPPPAAGMLRKLLQPVVAYPGAPADSAGRSSAPLSRSLTKLTLIEAAERRPMDEANASREVILVFIKWEGVRLCSPEEGRLLTI